MRRKGIAPNLSPSGRARRRPFRDAETFQAELLHNLFTTKIGITFVTKGLNFRDGVILTKAKMPIPAAPP